MFKLLIAFAAAASLAAAIPLDFIDPTNVDDLIEIEHAVPVEDGALPQVFSLPDFDDTYIKDAATGQCPIIYAKDASECLGASSSCWSPGEEDIDCDRSQLCCFDGCANHCR